MKLNFENVKYYVKIYSTKEILSGPFDALYQALNWIDENIPDGKEPVGMFVDCEYKFDK